MVWAYIQRVMHPASPQQILLSGTNLSRRANISNISSHEDLVELHKSYILWNEDVKVWAGEQNTLTPNDWMKLFEGSAVPNILAGLEYRNTHSPTSQKLILCINSAVKDTLEQIRAVPRRLTTQDFEKVGNALWVINEKEIRFNEGTNPATLFEILLSQPSKEWANDELCEAFQLNEDEYRGTQKFYQAARKINERLEKHLGINDFVIAKTAMVQINGKYL